MKTHTLIHYITYLFVGFVFGVLTTYVILQYAFEQKATHDAATNVPMLANTNAPVNTNAALNTNNTEAATFESTYLNDIALEPSTNDRQEYRNSTLGFRFEYPATWKVEARQFDYTNDVNTDVPDAGKSMRYTLVTLQSVAVRKETEYFQQQAFTNGADMGSEFRTYDVSVAIYDDVNDMHSGTDTYETPEEYLRSEQSGVQGLQEYTVNDLKGWTGFLPGIDESNPVYYFEQNNKVYVLEDQRTSTDEPEGFVAAKKRIVDSFAFVE